MPTTLETVSDVYSNSKHTVVYDDYVQRTIHLAAGVWRSSSSCVFTIPATRPISAYVPSVLAKMLQHFANKPFRRHEAQGISPYAAANAYKLEE